MNWQFPWHRQGPEPEQQPQGPVGYYFDGGRWRHYEEEQAEAERVRRLEARLAAEEEAGTRTPDGWLHIPGAGRPGRQSADAEDHE